MWNRLSLRARITVLTMLALFITMAALTYLFNLGVLRTFQVPLRAILDDIEISPRYDMMPIDIDFDFEFKFPTRITDITDVEVFDIFYMNPDAHDEFRTYSIIIIVAFMIAGVFVAYIISVQSLKPVKVLAEKIEETDANNLTSFIEPPQSKDELARLANSFNNMLGKLNRSFEQQKLFSQNAAHELKTPLTAILTNIEVLQMDERPSQEEYKEVIDTIKANTEHLIKFVDGLLLINAVADEADWQSFNGRAVFEKIVKELVTEAEKKKLCVEIVGDCRIRGDEVLLTRAFQNLVHNAVRYNVEGGMVKIILSEESISIEDSGVGIPEDALKNIFEPLFCVDKARSKKLGGHGLGLAITKSILEKSHVKINITSKLDAGTKILLELAKI
ncbi:MAG: HAMP domain-containing histidine kinase [Defluviitaleaceae bacterium]|nr:HAMP domain-containing histidine kinase [Defluviitaleaceae bacterium]